MARQIPQGEVRVRSPLPTTPLLLIHIGLYSYKFLTALVVLTHNILRGLFDVPLNMSGYPTNFLFFSIPFKISFMSRFLNIAA